MSSSKILKVSIAILLIVSIQFLGVECRDERRDERRDDSFLWDYIIKPAAVGVGCMTVPYLVLPALGYTAAGVGVGTIAAAAQSSIGNVAAGSAFAALQSLGATGITAGMVAKAAAGGIAANAAREIIN